MGDERYQPTIIDIPEVGLREFVIRDCAFYSGPANDDGVETLYDMQTGDVIGWRWPS